MLVRTLQRLRRFCRNEDGLTAVEYMFITSLIVIVCLLTIRTAGEMANQSFLASSNSISDAIGEQLGMTSFIP